MHHTDVPLPTKIRPCVVASVASLVLLACGGAERRGVPSDSAVAAGGDERGVVATARGAPDAVGATDAVVGGGDDASDAQRVQPEGTARRAPRWSPLADSVERFVVLAPVGETTFVAASRAKRVLLDLGRMDLDVRKDSALRAAMVEVVRARAPIAEGSHVALRGAWGREVAEVGGFEYYNARVVAVLRGSARLDSLAAQKTPLTALATPTRDTAVAVDSAASPCDRTLSPLLTARVKLVRDSLLALLRAGEQAPYERMRRRMSTQASWTSGCFGGAWRVALAANYRTATLEWARETVVLVDTLGKVQPVKVNDLRFRVHELLHALDADGDGVDDLATKGATERAGATTILRYDAKGKRFERVAAGFAWESF